MTRKGSRSAALTVAGALAVAAVLAIALNGKRDEFAEALQSAPLWVLAVVAALQVLALVTRCEAWRTCVEAAGATISRRRLFRAGGLGNLGSLVNAQLGAAARIAVLRRSAPDETPKIPALIAAEIPIIMIEGMLAALSSYTLVGPLGLPWWTPLIAFAVMLGVVIVLSRLAGRGHGFCQGLAVLRSMEGRKRVIALVLIAVFAQIARNWLVLWALGVDAPLPSATSTPPRC
jgi:uncharacterized membrane protein YbhN (UPF0104 family)